MGCSLVNRKAPVFEVRHLDGIPGPSPKPSRHPRSSGLLCAPEPKTGHTPALALNIRPCVGGGGQPGRSPGPRRRTERGLRPESTRPGSLSPGEPGSSRGPQVPPAEPPLCALGSNLWVCEAGVSSRVTLLRGLGGFLVGPPSRVGCIRLGTLSSLSGPSPQLDWRGSWRWQDLLERGALAPRSDHRVYHSQHGV